MKTTSLKRLKRCSASAESLRGPLRLPQQGSEGIRIVKKRCCLSKTFEIVKRLRAAGSTSAGEPKNKEKRRLRAVLV